MTTIRSEQARRELDRRFQSLDVASLKARPHRGWIRAVRSALGMSQGALGARLGVAQSAIAQLERAELSGGITVAKLAEVARALDCSLVYALVPNTTLEGTVQREARRVAEDRLGYVATTMALEDQAVTPQHEMDRLEQIAGQVIASGEVWPSPARRRRAR